MNRIFREWLPQARLWIVLGAAIAGIAVFVALSRQPNQWRSRADLLIQLPQAASTTSADWSRAASTYAQLARGQTVLSATITSTHSALTSDNLAAMVRVALLPDTELLTVEVTANDPTTAQNLSDELARQIVSASVQLTANPDADKLHGQIDTLNTQIDAARASWQAIDTQINSIPPPSPATLADLRTRRADAIDHYLLLQANLGELNSQYLQLTRSIPQITVADGASAAEMINTISPLPTPHRRL